MRKWLVSLVAGGLAWSFASYVSVEVAIGIIFALIILITGETGERIDENAASLDNKINQINFDLSNRLVWNLIRKVVHVDC
jgi:hypothetical protein